MRILIAENDGVLSNSLAAALAGDQHATDVARQAPEVLQLVAGCDYDLAILDLGIPDRDGWALLEHLHTMKPSLPVLVLAASATTEDRLRSLDLGAADHLSKPFAVSEFLARARALLQRSRQATEAVAKIDDLELSRLEHRVSRAGRPLSLTPREFALLDYLMRNAGRPVTRVMILQNAWSIFHQVETNIVDVYINYLRRKVDKQFDRKLIRTVRGVGYQLDSTA